MLIILSIFLCQFLSHCIVGASLDEIEDEEDAASVQSDGIPPKEGTYKIIGTLQDATKGKPDWVQEVIDVSMCVYT